MEHGETPLTAERRARLASKGRLLYSKFCGTGGRGVCAESFALYHIWRGEPIVAEDLLAFLDERIEGLRVDDPNGRLELTRALRDRLRLRLLDESTDEQNANAPREPLDRRGLVGPIGIMVKGSTGSTTDQEKRPGPIG